MADNSPNDQSAETVPAEIVELGIRRAGLMSKLSPNDVNDLTRFIKATIDGWLLRKK